MSAAFAGRRVLVTGGSGLIGRPLVERLLAQGARVRVASLDESSRVPAGAEHLRVNLMEFARCREACDGMDYVFHLAGIKGSPAMTAKKPASFFVPTILFNTNMMEAARQAGVEGYLYTSTIGVYAPAEVLREDAVWTSFPSPHDKFAGWAKRMGELQAEAYAIEHGWNRVSIVRPANVYGPYDNFDPANAMVIPALIHRAVGGENPLRVWGDGSQIRDFIHADDVARGMLLAAERGAGQVVNLGSGVGVTVRRIVEIITGALDPAPEIVWDTSKPSGDARRVMDVARAAALGFAPQVSIEDGVQATLAWYQAHRAAAERRYNVFTEAAYI